MWSSLYQDILCILNIVEGFNQKTYVYVSQAAFDQWASDHFALSQKLPGWHNHVLFHYIDILCIHLDIVH